ncbi:unnamed protein product [Auanema sp. JU1783]|nr:unnamed protein product [Auanema sp. JU1783]
MFSEHKKTTNVSKHSSTKEKKFDTLEEKVTNGIAQMNVKDGKVLKKYTSDTAPEMRKSLKKDGASSSASLILRSNSKKGEIQRSNSDDKKDLSKGLFEAASVMCNIVDITKDSTMKNGRNEADPKKFNAKPNKSCLSAQSGPFAALKENAQKKKKSLDGGDD